MEETIGINSEGSKDKNVKSIKNSASVAMTLGILFIFASIFLVFLSLRSLNADTVNGMPVFLVGLFFALMTIFYFAGAIYFINSSRKIKQFLSEKDLQKISEINSKLFITSLILAILSLQAPLAAFILAACSYYFYRGKEDARKLA